jgi:hypothetical protein
MSVSGASGISAAFGRSTTQSTLQQAFAQLFGGFTSGNLSAAQQGYAPPSQPQNNGQSPSANSNTPFSQALSEIGQALQGGTWTASQQDLSSLQQAQGGRQHDPGHHADGVDSAAAPVGTLNPPSGASAATTNNLLNVTA